MDKPSLEFLTNLARKAGSILMDGYGKKHQIEYKGEIDLVTAEDYKAEGMILKFIRKEFADHKIVSEEDGISNLNEKACWYVDPIDGTVNYAHDIPFFSVSLAFGQGANIEVGVVYDPVRDEMFSAELGKGAFLNGKLIQISRQIDLGKSLLCTGFSYDIRNETNNNLQNYGDLALTSQGVRRLGSAALELCYVAAGRFDGFWEQKMGSWDIAAGQLIAREAGAKVTGKDGHSNCLEEPVSIIAANPELHQQILEILLKNADESGWD